MGFGHHGRHRELARETRPRNSPADLHLDLVLITTPAARREKQETARLHPKRDVSEWKRARKIPRTPDFLRSSLPPRREIVNILVHRLIAHSSRDLFHGVRTNSSFLFPHFSPPWKILSFHSFRPRVISQRDRISRIHPLSKFR